MPTTRVAVIQARIGSRTPSGRNDFLRYRQSAIDGLGPATQRPGFFAAKIKAHLVVGVIEREQATLYCAVFFLAPGGTLLAKHRKLMPTASGRLIRGQGDGCAMPVLDTLIGRIGAAVCWENYMPMFRQSLYEKGVQLWCAPTVDEREIWQASIRHIASGGALSFSARASYQRVPRLGRNRAICSPGSVLTYCG